MSEMSCPCIKSEFMDWNLYTYSQCIKRAGHDSAHMDDGGAEWVEVTPEIAKLGTQAKWGMNP